MGLGARSPRTPPSAIDPMEVIVCGTSMRHIANTAALTRVRSIDALRAVTSTRQIHTSVSIGRLCGTSRTTSCASFWSAGIGSRRISSIRPGSTTALLTNSSALRTGSGVGAGAVCSCNANGFLLSLIAPAMTAYFPPAQSVLGQRIRLTQAPCHAHGIFAGSHQGSEGSNGCYDSLPVPD